MQTLSSTKKTLTIYTTLDRSFEQTEVDRARCSARRSPGHPPDGLPPALPVPLRRLLHGSRLRPVRLLEKLQPCDGAPQLAAPGAARNHQTEAHICKDHVRRLHTGVLPNGQATSKVW
jgi:hypothetical protein